jgi:hypothetical protein
VGLFLGFRSIPTPGCLSRSKLEGVVSKRTDGRYRSGRNEGKGWSSFRPTIQAGLDHIFAAHPNRNYLRLASLQLLYLNIFSEAHGLESTSSYVRNVLRIGVDPPKALIATALDGIESIRHFGTLRFPLIKPEGGSGAMIWNEAARAGKPVLSLDLSVKVEMALASEASDAGRLVDIFDEAHNVITRWFEGFAQTGLKGKIGDKVQI